MPIAFSTDLKAKARHMYGVASSKTCFQALLSDGTSAVLYFRLASFCYRHKFLVPFGMIIARINMILNGIVVGRNAQIGSGLIVMHSVGVVINTNAVIGMGAIFQSGVVVGVRNKKSPIIGDNVYFGSGCKVMGELHVGSGAKIGANAVVLSDVPDNCTAVGVPARILDER